MFIWWSINFNVQILLNDVLKLIRFGIEHNVANSKMIECVWWLVGGAAVNLYSIPMTEFLRIDFHISNDSGSNNTWQRIHDFKAKKKKFTEKKTSTLDSIRVWTCQRIKKFKCKQLKYFAFGGRLPFKFEQHNTTKEEEEEGKVKRKKNSLTNYFKVIPNINNILKFRHLICNTISVMELLVQVEHQLSHSLF